MLLDAARRQILDALAGLDVTVVDHDPQPGQIPPPFIAVWLDGWDRDYWRHQVRLYVDAGVGARTAQERLAELALAVNAALPVSLGVGEMSAGVMADAPLLVASWRVATVRSFTPPPVL